jgi:hypothetical protein
MRANTRVRDGRVAWHAGICTARSSSLSAPRLSRVWLVYRENGPAEE